MASTDRFHVWQWNGHTFLNKKASLRQIIRSMGSKPKVTVLEETLSEEVKLTSYKSICKKKNIAEKDCSPPFTKTYLLSNEIFISN